MAVIRTFVAIPLNHEIECHLDQLAQRLQGAIAVPAVRWVAPKNIHLTLKFLGDVDEARIEDIREALRRAITPASSFSLRVSGMGCFPNIRRPRIVWAGVQEPSGALKLLADQVESELSRLGFAREEREFSPHLTLGRVRRDISPNAMRKLGRTIENLHPLPIGEQLVDAIHLFRSDLRPAGPVYTSLAELALPGPLHPSTDGGPGKI